MRAKGTTPNCKTRCSALSSMWERRKEKDRKAMICGKILCFCDVELKANIKYKKLEMTANLWRPVLLFFKKKSLVYLHGLSTTEAPEPFLLITFVFLPMHYNSSKWDPLQQNTFPFSSLPFSWSLVALESIMALCMKQAYVNSHSFIFFFN